MAEKNNPSVGGMRPPRYTFSREVRNGQVLTEDGREITMSTWLGSEPEFDRIDEEYSADIVVCGGGIAGVCAARAAVEAGATVALFERCATIQGRSTDFAIIGSEFEKKWWNRDNSHYKDRLLKDFMRDVGWRANYRTIKYWADNCGAAFDWYLEPMGDIQVQQSSVQPVPEGSKLWVTPKQLPQNPHWDPDSENEYYTTYPVTVAISPSHVPVLRENYRLAEETGRLRGFFNTPAMKLVKDGSGAVTGVIGRNLKDGTVVKVNAKAVILATGDFASNQDMVFYYLPWARFNTFGFPSTDINGVSANQGDGHRMAIWAGGQMEEGPIGMINHNMGGALGVAAFLMLNNNGERFMNEDVTGQEVDNQLVRQPKAIAYQIFDAKWHEQVEYMNPGHASVYGIIDEPLDRRAMNMNYVTREHIEGACESGRCVRGETPGELLDKLELSNAAKAEALLQIARYNELCHNGQDEDFGKRPDRMFPVECGPFYASRFTPAGVLAVLGGIDSDHNLRCLDAEKKPIAGLYCAGNCQGGRFPVEYPMTIPGMSHSLAMTHGRLAGMIAAQSVADNG